MNRLRSLRTFSGSRIIRISLRQSGDISEHFKRLIDSRENDEIVSYLEAEQSSGNQDFKVDTLYADFYSSHSYDNLV